MCVACGQHRAGRWQVAGVVAATHQLAVERVVTAVEQVLDPHADLIIFTELVLADHVDGGVTVDLAPAKACNAIQTIVGTVEIGGLHAVTPVLRRFELQVGGQFERWYAVPGHVLPVTPFHAVDPLFSTGQDQAVVELCTSPSLEVV